VTRWENKADGSAALPADRLSGEVLVARLHVDLQRVASAVCPRS
jgi:hypothetical protein